MESHRIIQLLEDPAKVEDQDYSNSYLHAHVIFSSYTEPRIGEERAGDPCKSLIARETRWEESSKVRTVKR